MIEVFAEISLFHASEQIIIGGGNKADICFYREIAAYRQNDLFLQRPEQFHLHLVAKIAHFVQKKCATRGRFKLAYFILQGSGKCTFYVPEQLTGCQFRSEAHTSEL